MKLKAPPYGDAKAVFGGEAAGKLDRHERAAFAKMWSQARHIQTLENQTAFSQCGPNPGRLTTKFPAKFYGVTLGIDPP